MNIAQINRRNGLIDERKEAWNYDGAADIEGSTNVAEALKRSGMDWQVHQVDIMNPLTGGETPFVMNLRNDTNDALGVVSRNYKPIQNQQAFDFVDNLSPLGITFERVGMTTKGNRMWMCVKLNEAELLGDKVNNHVILTNSHDGSGSMKVTMAPMRLACHNVLSWVFRRNAERSQAIRHTGKTGEKLAEAQKVYALAEQYMAALSAEAEELSKIKVAPADFTAISEKLFPITEEDTIRTIDKQEQNRYFLKKAWEQDDLGDHRGTGWGMMNAIADFEQHRVRTAQSAINTVIDGSRISQTALEILHEM